MTLTADERLPANYMHVYWSEESNGLPAPKGLFAKHLEKENKSHAMQRLEAAKLLTYINSVPVSYDGDLLAHGLPFPMILVKVPGTHNVRFITGLAPLLQDAFQPPDPNHRQLHSNLTYNIHTLL